MVQTGRVLFDSKYTTAVIMDESDRAHFVPIKSVVGDYFLAEIEKQIYVFTLKGARIYTKRQSATRSFRFILYETSHFRCLNLAENKEVELVISKNKLPKINLMLFSVLKELGRREKGITPEGKLETPHELKALIDEISQDETRYTEQIRNIKEYLSHIKVEQIVTPVQRLANFLDEDLIETDASFYGEVVSRYKRTDDEHKIIMNKPVKASKHWVKWVGIIAIMALIGVAAVLLFGGSNMQAPNLGNLIPGFNMGAPGQMSLTDFQKIYPNPIDAKKAVDSGALSMDQIPPQLRDIVKNFKEPIVIPQAAPQNHEINITP